MAGFFPQHIISIRDLSIDFVFHLLQAAEHMRNVVQNSGGDDSLKNKVAHYELDRKECCDLCSSKSPCFYRSWLVYFMSHPPELRVPFKQRCCDSEDQSYV